MKEEVYEGTEPYVFVSYAHADKERVVPLIQGLQRRGIRVWYDIGIEFGEDWLQVIVEHLERSTCVVSFITPNYIASDNCVRELIFAIDEGYGLIMCHLEKTTLPAKLRFQTKLSNAMMRKAFPSDEAYLDALAGAKMLKSCKMEEKPQPVQEDIPEHDWDEDDHVALEGKLDLIEEALQIGEEPPLDPAEADFREGSRLFNEGDFAGAIACYVRAAENGHLRAKCNLGFCYDRGRGVMPDPAQALKWYRSAAEQGDAAAQFHVAYCLDKGRGVEPDPAEAVKFYEMAAKQGHVRAQCNLAACCAAGRGVDQDPARALYWYEQAAEQGDAEGQFNAGFCYDKGRGTEPDPEKAVKWYARAAAQEDARALFNLGLCHENGRGTRKNPALAVNCYTRAANRDHRAAQYRLGLCYQEGIGVAKDRRKAEYWKKKSQEKSL